MTENNFTCALHFSGYSIEFYVKMDESMLMTDRFNHLSADFVFVVAETWLTVSKKKYLVIPAVRPANMIEEFKVLSEELSNLTAVPNLENLIPCGGWIDWMDGYWRRLKADTPKLDDKINYNQIISCSQMSSRIGDIATYLYNGEPIMEVAVRNKNGKIITSVFSKFDHLETVKEIHDLEQLMKEKILNAVRKK